MQTFLAQNGSCKWFLGAPDNYVECPLQPEHLQFLLWRGGGPADNEVSANEGFQISPSTWIKIVLLLYQLPTKVSICCRFTRDMLPYWYNQMINHKLGRTFQVLIVIEISLNLLICKYLAAAHVLWFEFSDIFSVDERERAWRTSTKTSLSSLISPTATIPCSTLVLCLGRSL